jgi:translocation and assembly module TamA
MTVRWLWCPLLWLVATPVLALAVTLEGIDGEPADNARAYLTIAALPVDATPARVRRAHRIAPDEIRKALQPFGYYRPAIEGELAGERGDWRARYRIEPGPATTIESLTVRIMGPGADDPRFQRAIDSGGLARGQRLRHARYEDTKARLQQAAYAGGYLDAEFTARELRVEPETATAEIRLILDSGPRYRFGEIDIRQDVLRDELMQRYIGIQPGEPFDPQRLLNAQYALNDSGYFERVEIGVDKEAADAAHRVPVTIRTQPRPKRRYTIGAGFGTDTGPRGRAGVEFRRLNRRGHRAEIDLRGSAVQNRLNSQYLIPVTNIRDDRYALKGIVNREDAGGGESELLLVGASRDKPILGWQASGYVNFERETTRFSGDADRSFLLTPGVSVTRTRADDPLFPRRGWSLFLDVHGAVEGVVSDISFLQTRLRGAGVLPLAPRLRLLLRGEIGANRADELAALPASQRFFAGGDRSVRGYGYESLGERNADGEVIGGRYLFTAGAELDWRIAGNWGAALFYDAGNAADTPDMDLKRGVGIGLRWYSPVGPVRLDLAHPLDDPDRDLRLHFTLGPDL